MFPPVITKGSCTGGRTFLPAITFSEWESEIIFKVFVALLQQEPGETGRCRSGAPALIGEGNVLFYAIEITRDVVNIKYLLHMADEIKNQEQSAGSGVNGDFSTILVGVGTILDNALNPLGKMVAQTLEAMNGVAKQILDGVSKSLDKK